MREVGANICNGRQNVTRGGTNRSLLSPVTLGTHQKILVEHARDFGIGNASRAQSLLQTAQQLRALVKVEAVAAIEALHATSKIVLGSHQASQLLRASAMGFPTQAIVVNQLCRERGRFSAIEPSPSHRPSECMPNQSLARLASTSVLSILIEAFVQEPMKSMLRFLRRFVASGEHPPPAPDAPVNRPSNKPQSMMGTDPTAAELDEIISNGNRHEDAGDWVSAEVMYRRALQLFPQSARALVNIGNVQSLRGQTEDACASFARALALQPDYASAHLNLGNMQLALKRPAEAEAAYRGALLVNPGWARAWTALGCALEARGRSSAAIEAYKEALRRDPDDAGAALNLGKLLSQAGDGDEAYPLLEDALRRNPLDSALELELAQLDRDLMQPAGAIARYRRVMERDPTDFRTWSNLLFTLNFLPSITPSQILDEHRRYAASRMVGLTSGASRTPSEPDRRLRIGYVSSDYRRHPVACFIEPLLRCHDRDRFETYCYYSHEDRDEVTSRLSALASVWRSVAGMSDEELAALIDADCIDILVDLAGHTNGNRLGVFARKPAPIQMTWLGYLATTGLSTIDYRLCDRYSDPEGSAEQWQVEQPLRLPDSQWCYQPPIDVSTASPMPYEANGFWTFGSFNQPAKLNESVLSVWSQLLAAVPDSRLRMVGLKDRLLRQRVCEFIQQQGIASERLMVEGRLPVAEYLAAYRGVDVALDTFPYNGGTTTCDALLMGVPVASVVGSRSVARGGLSLLENVGLRDWLAPSPEHVSMIVKGQLAQPQRLSELRSQLPGRMRSSALMDAPRFANSVEEALRHAWVQACLNQSPTSSIYTASPET